MSSPSKVFVATVWQWAVKFERAKLEIGGLNAIMVVTASRQVTKGTTRFLKVNRKEVTSTANSVLQDEWYRFMKKAI